MKAEMENYKAELSALRHELAIKDAKGAGLNNQPTSATSRRRMLKSMVAGAAGLSALSIAALATSSNQAFAETASDNGIEVTSGANGYGGKFTSPFAQLQLVPAGALPTSFTGHNLGELFVDSTGALYYSISTTGGATPNAWRKLSGTGTAGVLNYLTFPDRFVNTQNGLGGTTGPVAAGAAPLFTLAGATGRDGQVIPAGATGVIGTLSVLSPSSSGLLKILPGGTPTASGTASLSFSAGVNGNAVFVCAFSAAGQILVFNSSAGTVQVLVDVVGYYR